MARTARIVSSTGIYHVMMRGINHRNIFRDNHDKMKFLQLMQGIVEGRPGLRRLDGAVYEIYAYALMGNHFHILMKVESGTVGDFVKVLAASYVLYFNRKYNRDGHLFRERFKSEPCESEDYFMTLLRYIHQNPIKAGIATDLLKYKYTSWQEFAEGEKSRFKICNVNYVMNKIPLEELSLKVYDLLEDDEQCIDIDKKAGKVSDEKLKCLLSTKIAEEGIEDIKNMSKNEKKELILYMLGKGAGVNQLSVIMGVSNAMVSRVKNKMTDSQSAKEK